MAKDAKEEDVPNVNVPVFPPLSEEEALSEKSYSQLEDEAGTSGGVGSVAQPESEEKAVKGEKD